MVGLPGVDQFFRDCSMAFGVVGLKDDIAVSVEAEPVEPVEDGVYRFLG